MADHRPAPLSCHRHRSRLKTKYREHGIDGWADYEVLEYALTFAIPRQDVKPVAKALLQRFSTIAGVLDADHADLRAVRGVGEHTALLLSFLRDMARWYLKDGLPARDLVSSPQAAIAYLRAALKGAADEEFHVLYLDTANQVLAAEKLQTGTVNRSAVYPRKIVERALQYRAAGVIIAHNHPAGTLQPSDDDRRATAAVRAALSTVDVLLLDHLIIAGNGYFSWKESGLL